jgi:hypothetical protein
MQELSTQEPDALESKFFKDEHCLRQLNFERSQVERKRHFQDGIQSRRHIFFASERIREDTFEHDQRDRAATHDREERAHDASFLHSQQERERKFLVSEARRVSSFCDAEAERVATDLKAQKKRGELFDSVQDKLQKQCSEDEAQRTSDLETWALGLLQERKQQQVDGYKDEERTREVRFVRSVDSRRERKVRISSVSPIEIP